MRIDAAVGRVGDPDAGLDRPPEGGDPCVHRLAQLAHRVRGPAEAVAFLERPLAVEQVDAEVGPAVGQHRDRVPVEQRAVLDGARTGPDRPLARPRRRARGPRRTRRSARPPRPRPGSPPRTAPARPATPPRVRTAPVPMHLMTVAPADQQPPDPLADLVGRGHHPEPEVVGEPDVVREPHDVAAAPRRGEERAGALHPGPVELAGIDLVAQGAVDERPERPEVANRREAGLDGRPRVAGAGQHLLGRAGRRRRHARGLDVADEVAVGVDEARAGR